jgi:hypothetical protein
MAGGRSRLTKEATQKKIPRIGLRPQQNSANAAPSTVSIRTPTTTPNIPEAIAKVDKVPKTGDDFVKPAFVVHCSKIPSAFQMAQIDTAKLPTNKSRTNRIISQPA